MHGKAWTKRRRVALVALLTALFAGTSLCASANDTAKPLTVITSIRPLALMVRGVAGDAAQVETLLPPGASPHHYSLRISDMRTMQQADLLVWLGPEFERFLADIARRREPSASLALAELPEMHWPTAGQPAASAHAHSGRDMHLWLDPDNGRRALRAIAERLAALRPEQADVFAENLAEAEAALETADELAGDVLSPLSHRGFGVSHDGFGHFVAHYGLNQLAAVSAMPDQAVSARHMMETADRLQDAQCLVVEAGEPVEANARLQRIFKIPVIKADSLALNPEIDRYPDLIADVTRSFRECLEGDAVE